MGKILVLLLLVAGVACHTHAHSHDHAHSHEPAHAKYGRAVNEQAAREAAEGVHHAHEHHGHSHSGGKCPHSHGHEDHGHAHEDHGHSHEDHGHAHADHGHSHDDHEHSHEGHGHSHDHKAPKKLSLNIDEYRFEGSLSFLNDPVTRTRWFAIGATLLISAFPCFILLFIPIHENTGESSSLLKVLLAFGSGGLLGDAFLHLIPHATPAGDSGDHDHAHSHEHHGHSHNPGNMSVGMWVLGGILAFLAIEKMIRIIRGDQGHGHGHSHGPKKAKLSDDESDEKEKKTDKKKKKEKCEKEEEEHGEDHQSIRIAAILNLFADFTHNFTDGLAIGASFSAGTTIGLVTTATVLVHEIPHEIGDFAILIKSGYSKPKAMAMQLITAIGALTGCIISLWATNGGALANAAEGSAILPFTAGGFIYIATVSVIPELLTQSSTWQSIKEIVAMLLGIYMMYLIALYE